PPAAHFPVPSTSFQSVPGDLPRPPLKRARVLYRHLQPPHRPHVAPYELQSRTPARSAPPSLRPQPAASTKTTLAKNSPAFQAVDLLSAATPAARSLHRDPVQALHPVPQTPPRSAQPRSGTRRIPSSASRFPRDYSGRHLDIQSILLLSCVS